jgi:hypothetical protein
MNTFEDRVLDGYLVAMLWSSSGEDCEYLDEKYSISDISETSIIDARKDVKTFLEYASGLLDEAETIEHIGHDLWLTRAGHGAGFWDGDYPQHGDKLTDICKEMGERYPYVGDDGMVYLD